LSDLKHSFCQAIENRRLSIRPLTQSFEQALSVARLNHLGDPDYQNLLAVVHHSLEMVEKDGQQKSIQGIEPAYHNRQHFADACLALAYFLRDIDQFTEYEKLLLLLVMLVHDFGHRGMSSKPSHMSHEEETVALLQQSKIQALPKKDFDLISELIIGTTPNNLLKTNSRYLNDPDNPLYLKQALINDADIAASYIDSLTPDLSKLILIELGNQSPSDHEIDAAVVKFKDNFHLTTKIAKYYLY